MTAATAPVIIIPAPAIGALGSNIAPVTAAPAPATAASAPAAMTTAPTAAAASAYDTAPDPLLVLFLLILDGRGVPVARIFRAQRSPTATAEYQDAGAFSSGPLKEAGRFGGSLLPPKEDSPVLVTRAARGGVRRVGPGLASATWTTVTSLAAH